MIAVQLYIFLFIFFAALLVFAVFAVFNIGHIVHTGSMTGVSFFVTLVTMIGAILVLYATYRLLLGVDWKMVVFTIDLQQVKNLFNSPPTDGF